MRKYIIMISIFILLILSSCSVKDLGPKEMINAPEIMLSPIKGKWTLDKVVDGPHKRSIDDSVNDEDIEALFHKDGVVVNGDFILEPSYKLRKVNLKDYLFYNYKIDLEYLHINKDEAEIITILSEDQYFNDFVRYDENKLFYYEDDKFVFLEKTVDEVSIEEINRNISIEKSIMRISKPKEIDTLNTGLLLGIKSHSFDEDKGLDRWDYKTIWIKSNNRTIDKIYEIDDLLVPRKKGFYLVNIDRENIGSIIYDKIRATAKFKTESKSLEENPSLYTSNLVNKSINYPSKLKHILYIGNDYVSTEEINVETKKKELRVYPIDFLEENKATKLSNIIGDEGLNLYFQSAKDAIKTDANHILGEENFGLHRRNGYWIIMGRINYQNDNKEFFKDFTVKTVPPKTLVHYDELIIPWNEIKVRIPQAIDAFTSPNEDIIIVVKRNEILLYPIIDNDIVFNELAKIQVADSDSIVMAEWGLGRYTNLWEEEFLKNNAVEVKNE